MLAFSSAEHFGVGQARGVVDRDVHALPADPVAVKAGAVDQTRVARGLRLTPRHALAGAALDAPELLDVDVDELARPLALVALGRLKPQPAQPAHPDPGQDPRHRRDRHASNSAISGPVNRKPPQRGDRFDPPLVGAVGDQMRRAAAIQQTELSRSSR